MGEQIGAFFVQLTWRDLIDFVIVIFLLYKITQLIRGTKAVQLLKGLLILVLGLMVSDWLGFRAINWILDRTLTVGIIAIPIVFQPELRRALEKLGRGRFLVDTFNITSKKDKHRALVAELVKACRVLSKRKMGALVVIERKTGIKDFVETGIQIDGKVSAELLLNIFMPRSPLHDGAVIIKDSVIRAAGCYLPLTEKESLSKELGTRHRAAIGITEHSDAVSVIVSEETGIISVAENGKIIRELEESELKKLLIEMWEISETTTGNFWQWKFGSE